MAIATVPCESVCRWIEWNKMGDVQYACIVTKHAVFSRVAIVEDRPNILVIEYPHRKSGDGNVGDFRGNWMIKREIIPRKDVVEMRYYQD